MPSTYTLISSNVLTSSAASVTFSAIPSTYTDLVLRFSVRASSAPEAIRLVLNSWGNGSQTTLYGNGASATSDRDTATSGTNLYNINNSSSTSNTFTSGEVYIPSYTVSQNKPLSAFHAQENNGTTAWIQATAGLKSSTASITSISFETVYGGNFVSGSSFYLYGIKNS
jgi:hypothetical protein